MFIFLTQITGQLQMQRIAERFSEEGAFAKLLAAREDRKRSKFEVAGTAPAAEEGPDLATPGMSYIIRWQTTKQADVQPYINLSSPPGSSLNSRVSQYLGYLLG